MGEKRDVHSRSLEALLCIEENRNRELESEVQHLRSSLSKKEIENSDLQRQWGKEKPSDARDQEENRTRELISELESLRSSLAMKENENKDLQSQLAREKYTTEALNEVISQSQVFFGFHRRCLHLQVSMELSTKLSNYEGNTAEKCSKCSGIQYQHDILQQKLDSAKRNNDADKK